MRHNIAYKSENILLELMFKGMIFRELITCIVLFSLIRLGIYCRANKSYALLYIYSVQFTTIQLIFNQGDKSKYFWCFLFLYYTEHVS